MGAGGADATVADKIVNATPLATEFHADGPPAGWGSRVSWFALWNQWR